MATKKFCPMQEQCFDLVVQVSQSYYGTYLWYIILKANYIFMQIIFVNVYK